MTSDDAHERGATRVRSGESGDSVHSASEDTDTAETPLRSRQTCPECDGRVINTDDDERVCEACGLVVSVDAIDHGPEWRSFVDDEQNRSRVGAPLTPTRHDRGLSTRIGRGDRDARGRALSARRRQTMQRLRKWDRRYKNDTSSEALRRGLGEIQRMMAALGLPDTVEETACVVYRRVTEEGLLPGRSIEGAATASVYAAARQCDYPRTFEEITYVSRIGLLRSQRTYRHITRELELNIEPADPKQHIPRFINNLQSSPPGGVGDGGDGDVDIDDSGPTRNRGPQQDKATVEDPRKLERIAMELVDVAIESGVANGRAPSSIAAAAIYTAGLLIDDPFRQSDVAESTDVSIVTIRGRYQEIVAELNE